MALVTFIGNGKDDPLEMRTFGLTFPLGVAIEVENPVALAKLAGNGHFRVGGVVLIEPPKRETLVLAPSRRGPGRPPKS